MNYIIKADCPLGGKSRRIGDIVPASKIITDVNLPFYISNGSVELEKTEAENKPKKKESI